MDDCWIYWHDSKGKGTSDQVQDALERSVAGLLKQYTSIPLNLISLANTNPFHGRVGRGGQEREADHVI